MGKKKLPIVVNGSKGRFLNRFKTPIIFKNFLSIAGQYLGQTALILHRKLCMKKANQLSSLSQMGWAKASVVSETSYI